MCRRARSPLLSMGSRHLLGSAIRCSLAQQRGTRSSQAQLARVWTYSRSRNPLGTPG
uniref:Uncharacterized protein n=1 Tax=Arundo donax TaxID=35708 RepID=A0A0A9E565_ARUDO